MALLISDSAMPKAGNLLADFIEGYKHNPNWTYRVVTAGSPITKDDDLLVSWEQRHIYADWIRNKMNRVFVLNPDNCDPHIRSRGVRVDKYISNKMKTHTVLRSYKRYMQDNKTELFTTMPRNWKGRTWFKIKDLVEISKTYDRHLLKTNHCRPIDCKHFVNPRMLKNKDYLKLESRDLAGEVINKDYDGVAFTLLQCVERMPWDMSVMGTLRNMPYHRIPKAYLEWLVYDGELDADRCMNTATHTHNNNLRDSILFYLANDQDFEMRNGEVELKDSWVNSGSWLPDTSNREYVKQWERMDFENRDLEWSEFSTSGYWVKDLFVSCGTSCPISFEAHGPATWLMIGEGKVKEDELPEHVTTGLTDFERNEKWLPAETENYDWTPPEIPKTYNKAVKVLFDLHTRMDIWEQRHDHLLNHSDLCMSDRDREAMDWEWKEHELEMDRMKDMYLKILGLYKDKIPHEWGMRKRFEAAGKVASFVDRKNADLFEEIVAFATSNAFEDRAKQEQEYLLAVTYKVREWRAERAKHQRWLSIHLANTRIVRPAASWEEVSKLGATIVSTSDSHKHAIRFAKTQSPNLKRKRPCYQ
jgi:hypothetical protein